MKRFLIGLALLVPLLANGQAAGPTDAITNWTPPTQYVDATPLPTSEISQYKVYCGQVSGGPYSVCATVPGTLTTAQISSLTPGMWYFVVTTVATNGLESVFSNQASKNILSTSKPNPPVIISVQ